jgi:hypothetical protein
VVRLFKPIFHEWFNAINDEELFKVGENILKVYADDQSAWTVVTSQVQYLYSLMCVV